MRFNAEIEYLRALAIGFVLVMHVPLLWIPYDASGIQAIQGWIHPATGVDLFFVISGYVMGVSFVGPFEAAEHAGASRGEMAGQAAVFWVRRVYRLFPASAVWLGITFACCLISAKTEIWLTPRAMFLKTVAGLISVRNFEELQSPSYFGYYWSLSVENQFYLILPLFLLLVRRAWRVPVVLGLCALNLVWRPGGELWWLFRYDGLLYGWLLFRLRASGATSLIASCMPRSTMGRAGYMLLAFGTVLAAPMALIGNHPLAWSVVNWGGAALVLAASLQQGVIAMPRVVRPALLWLGSRSYALYLCHIPIWFAVLDGSQRLRLDALRLVPGRVAVGVAASLIAADLTHRWIERPLQRRGRVRAAEIAALAFTPPRRLGGLPAALRAAE